MKRKLYQLKKFEKQCDILFRRKKLSVEDFEEFKKELLFNPTKGTVVPGLSGIRKIRLKSSTSGKRGSFRVCYYYHTVNEEIFLIFMYAKNEQENLDSNQEKMLKEIIQQIKKRI